MNHQDLLGRITVNPDIFGGKPIIRGMRISVELIGEVEVRGKLVSEVQAEIKQRLREFIVQPEVTVTLASTHSRYFYVFGEVGRAGAYPLDGDVTVLQGLFVAGGPTFFAVLDSSRLIRPTLGESEVFLIDYEAITERGTADTNYLLEPNDVIYVPPNLSARIGYTIQIIMFPIQALLWGWTRVLLY